MRDSSGGDAARPPERALRVGWVRAGVLAGVAFSTSLMGGAPAAGQEVRYSGSLQYATGSYVFAQRSHTLYLLSGLTVRTRRFDLTASVPVIVQNGGIVSYVGGEPVPTGGRDHGALRHREPGSTVPTRRGSRDGGMGPGHGPGMGGVAPPSSSLAGASTAQGAGDQPSDSVTFTDDFGAHLGDPLLQGGVELYSGFDVLRSIRISGSAKVPVADLDSGVGTGEWDYSAGASLTLGIGGAYVFGDVSYWWLGDLPELKLRDGFGYGLGVGASVLDGRGTLLATASGARSSVATADAPVMVGLSLGYRLGEGRSLSFGASVGLSESSPDLSTFVGWTLGF